MLSVFTSARHAYTVRRFFDTWRTTGDPTVDLLTYEHVALGGRHAGGTFIFTDHERLLRHEHALAGWLANRLTRAVGHHRVLNHPAGVVRRFDLLRLLRQQGINGFAAYRPDELGPQVRFPAFVRNDYEHRGASSRLVHSLAEARAALHVPGRRAALLRDRFMVVEFVDTADARGVYRKYSAMKIGRALIPRHIFFSSRWETKKPDIVTEETAREERAFVDDFPHREAVAEAFRLAGIDYGRIDYGLKDGRIQVWEINTNPVLAPAREVVDQRRLPAQTQSVRMMMEAFKALDDGAERTAATRPFLTASMVFWKPIQLLARVYGRFRQ